MADHGFSDWGSFVSGDGIKSSAPWRLGAHGDGGALSDAQMGELSSRFGFSIDEMRSLSRSLGWALDPDMSPYLVPLDRSIARQRAAKLLAEAVKDLEAIEARLAGALTRLQTVCVDRIDHPMETKLLSSVRAQLRSAGEQIEAAQASVNALMQNPAAALVPVPTNKRKIIDFRRHSVVFIIEFFLHKSGRDFGFTTHDRNADRRTGPLIEFVNAIVPLITDPPSTLSAETVIKDITTRRQFADMSDDDEPVSVRSDETD